ncbi:MAG: hypothetical protein JSW45_11355 [Thiotrichales bacterium]|nr:MAG: hypothetical protein JSW45_11355 [Thiotrichales bacterium]
MDERSYLGRARVYRVAMVADSLLRFSSTKDEIKDKVNKSDELMPKSLSKKLASIANRSPDRAESRIDTGDISLDELAEISRSMLLDENLEVSKVRPFFWTMVETYVDRFQIFPFDAIKALFSYLELHEYPEEEMRELVKRLEKLYKKQHGRPMQESEPVPDSDENGVPTLDEEINELRETLKYAAIVGERLGDEK